MQSSGISNWGGRLHLLSAAALGVLVLVLLLPSGSKATSGPGPVRPRFSAARSHLRRLGRRGARLPAGHRSRRGDRPADRTALQAPAPRHDRTPDDDRLRAERLDQRDHGFVLLQLQRVGSTFACRIDGGSWGSCGSPKDYSGLATGDHQFSVRATDAAGNTDTSPATRTWTVAAPEDRSPRRLQRTPPHRTRRSPPAPSQAPRDHRLVLLQLERVGLDLRLPHRQWQLGLVRLPEGLLRPRDRRSPVLGARHRRGRKHRHLARNRSWTSARRHRRLRGTVASAPPPDTTAPNTTISSGPRL